MQTEIDELKAERDELVKRLTDAVERMEELATLAQQSPADTRSAPPPPPSPAPSQPPPPPPPPRPAQHDPEPVGEDTSLAARLEQAERERRSAEGKVDDSEQRPASPPFGEDEPANGSTPYVVGSDKRSFYSRNSAKLPRLEGDGGRSVLSAVGDMRPDSEPRGRKGRRRKKG